MTPAPGAFFDVDHTLITGASMFELLAYEVATDRRSRADHDDVMGGLRAMKAAGADRAEVNRAFYRRAYAGRAEAEVAATGREWFAAALGRGDLFRPEALDRLRWHVAAGHRVVLVSGSFPPCLDPLLAHVGAHEALCSRPAVAGGRYSGELAAPMIGAAKATAVAACAAAHGLSLAASYAYGDHESDLPLLLSVGHPHVVAPAPSLALHATTHNWPTL